jgi:hypothetical protein
MVTSRVIEELTRPPEVEEPRTAPVQSGVPAGRRTRVSPGDAKVPRTLRVVCVFGAMVEGENPTSGGDGGGDGGGGEGGGEGGGGEGGGGDGGGGEGGGGEGSGGEGGGGEGGGAGGDGGEGGGDGGGGEGGGEGGGDGGGGDGGASGTHTRQPVLVALPSEFHVIVPGPKMKLEGPPPPEKAVNDPDGWLGMRRKS